MNPRAFRATRIFDSRLDAGRRLARALAAYRGRHPLVLAIPRGAVAMGAAIAAELRLLRQRRAQYTPARPPADPAGRIAIVVDAALPPGRA